MSEDKGLENDTANRKKKQKKKNDTSEKLSDIPARIVDDNLNI